MYRQSITRRTALKALAGAGTALAFGDLKLFAHGIDALLEVDAAELVTKAIPSSGERIPVIGIGTARRYDVGGTSAELQPLREVLRDFVRLGGKLIDTAAGYGRAEQVLGQLISELGIRDEIFLATKVGAGRQSVAAGLAEIERSKERLGTNRFDLLQIHNLGGVDAMLPVVREMKDAGTIRYYGVTTTSEQQYAALEQLLRNEEMDFLQIDYAIDNRSAEERILPLAADRGVAVLTALPLGRGRVFDSFGDQPVPEWATEFGISTWAQFALKYIISHPAVTAAIPGTARPIYLLDNLGAARGELPDESTRRRMAALVDSA